MVGNLVSKHNQVNYSLSSSLTKEKLIKFSKEREREFYLKRHMVAGECLSWVPMIWSVLLLFFLSIPLSLSVCSFACHFVCPSVYLSSVIGKKVEVSLPLFDIFERNRVFIFLWESWGTLRLIGASDEIHRVSTFNNSLSFGAKQKSLGQIFFVLWIFKNLFIKNSNWVFFSFIMILSRINKGV